MAKKIVSVILPVYNEERVLEKNVKSLDRILEKSIDDFEIIISEDGSTDKTPEIVKSLESDRIKILQREERIGKGAAIKTACSYAKADIIIFMDADLASNPEYINDLIGLIGKGASIVIASRYLKDSKSKRGLVRYFASKSFNWLVRNMLGSKLTDHQCGFKAFKKEDVLPLINEIENERWFWDTELLIRAQRKRLKIVEIPIEWREANDSKFNLFRDTCQMAKSLILFKIKHG